MATENFSIEFATHQLRSEIKVDAEGKGTCSIRGVARLGGKDDSQLGKDLKTGAGLQPSKIAEYLIQCGFEGAGLAIWGQTGIPDLAVASILEYWAFETDARYQSKQAALVYRAFARIGVRAWMQQVTGWTKQPETEVPTLEQQLEALVPATPKTWTCRFPSDFWIALENLYGLKREKRACAMFIKTWVYDYLPAEVNERLDEINPILDGSFRARQQHRHIDGVLSRALDMQIQQVKIALMQSNSRDEFKARMSNIKRYKFTMSNVQKIGGSK